jgi:hypothetical protein
LLPQAALRGPRPSTVEHHAEVHGLARPPLLRAGLRGLRLSAVAPRATLRDLLRHAPTNGQSVDRPSARGVHAFHCRGPRLRSERTPPPSAALPIHLGTRAHCGWLLCLPPLSSRLQRQNHLALGQPQLASLSRPWLLPAFIGALSCPEQLSTAIVDALRALCGLADAPPDICCTVRRARDGRVALYGLRRPALAPGLHRSVDAHPTATHPPAKGGLDSGSAECRAPRLERLPCRLPAPSIIAHQALCRLNLQRLAPPAV